MHVLLMVLGVLCYYFFINWFCVNHNVRAPRALVALLVPPLFVIYFVLYVFNLILRRRTA